MSAKRGRTLPVNYAPSALKELNAIWEWNAKYYSRDHAERYLGFLLRRIQALSEHHGGGRILESRPEFRYVVIRRSGKGHGHVAVYRFNDQEVQILHVLHTAQDWQTTVEDEERLSN